MAKNDLTDKLVVAISSRALFDFEEENAVFETANDEAYMRLQLERLEQPAKAGVAFITCGDLPIKGIGALQWLVTPEWY